MRISSVSSPLAVAIKSEPTDGLSFFKYQSTFLSWSLSRSKHKERLLSNTGAIPMIFIVSLSASTPKFPRCLSIFRIRLSNMHIRLKSSPLPIFSKNPSNDAMLFPPVITPPAFTRPICSSVNSLHLLTSLPCRKSISYGTYFLQMISASCDARYSDSGSITKAELPLLHRNIPSASRTQHLAYEPSVPNSGEVDERAVSLMAPSNAAFAIISSKGLL